MKCAVLVFLFAPLGLLHAGLLPDEPVLQTQENFDVKQRARRNVVRPPAEEGLGDDTFIFMGPVACRLPMDPGPCDAHIKRWAFDSAAGKCVPFIYGGCKGNSNNFSSQEQCEEFCGGQMRTASVDTCKLEPDSGPCTGSFPRYYYNSSIMTCEMFSYGGCMGNQNNFETEMECFQSCRTEATCRRPMDPGPCHESINLWAFNSAAGKCVPFIYGGCKGNGNKFLCLKDCEEFCGGQMRTDTCKLEPDSGPCKGGFQRYYYNSTTMTCEKFTYGGCMGNQNNFVTAKECYQTCRTETICRRPMVTGPCRAHMKVWGFDSATGKCVPFIYGGCKGTGNRFSSQKECEDFCGGQMIIDTCKLEPDSGPCIERVRHYFYNSSSMACQKFTYGGCMGNQNNFETEIGCLQSCGTEATCKLPMDPGPCRLSIHLWGFDSAAGKCVSFIYGGCEGNGNKFSSQKECEEFCGGQMRKGDDQLLTVN